jgi:hypothetical protein
MGLGPRDGLDDRGHFGRKAHARGERLLEALELGGVRELAVPEQVDDFLEAAVGGQVLDGVAAVDQGHVMDRADLARAGDDVLEAFVGAFRDLAH